MFRTMHDPIKPYLHFYGSIGNTVDLIFFSQFVCTPVPHPAHLTLSKGTRQKVRDEDSGK